MSAESASGFRKDQGANRVFLLISRFERRRRLRSWLMLVVFPVGGYIRSFRRLTGLRA